MVSSESQLWDVVILGAGASGLISARILKRGGSDSILVIDRYARAGGNHIDVRAGSFTFDIGFFVFQDPSPFMRYFPGIADLYVDGSFTCTRVVPSGDIYEYPFSLQREVIARGPFEWFRVAASLLRSRIFGRRIVSALDYARYWMGGRFLRLSGLERYIERFYGLPAAQIEREFAQKRMTWIERGASPNGIARRFLRLAGLAKPGPRPRDLVRPASGFATIYDCVRADLESEGIHFALDRKLKRIVREGGAFVLEDADGAILRARRLISTIPIEECLALCGMTAHDDLVETSTLVSLCYSFSGDRGFTSTILYNFSNEGDWKRITMSSDFYGQVDGREYFTVEITRGGSIDRPSIEDEDRAFRRDAATKSLFVGDLRLETSHVLENAYPVYRFGATAAAATAVGRLHEFGIESFGRQGGFEYTPNTSDAIHIAERKLAGRAVPAE